MKVFTKQIGPNGKWHSGCTFKGYDYSESGGTIEQAQGNIRAKLAVMGVEFEEIKWEKPVPYLYRKEDERSVDDIMKGTRLFFATRK